MKKQNTMYTVFSGLIKLVVTIAVILVIYLGALVAYDFGYRLFAEKPVSLAPGREVTVIIEEGMSTNDVADLLEEQGMIRDALIFKLQCRLSHYKTGFYAGTYTINTSMTNEEIMAVLSGEVKQE